ncbi:cytochrome c biogenesis CcdA family protein [Ancylobacter sp. IITR112]|uniref:cytochrome c biogenesis CcdA family protein n=1 Tax=Ancylobacter sp. IITR112 TaxID=3138073 RepID=UPI00352A7DE3
MSLDITLPGAFAAGLLSFASPCVLPLVPAYLGFLGGAGRGLGDGQATRGRLVRLSFAFVAGFSSVFILLGATASQLGQWLALQAPVLTVAAGALLVLFGLHFLGLLRVPLLYRRLAPDVARAPAGLVGAYLVGLAFGFGWSPCVGPILSMILIIAGTEDSLARGMLLLGAYAAGIGLPFIAAAAFSTGFLRWSAAMRSRLGLVEKASGVLLVATGIVFIGGWMPHLAAWLLDAFPTLGAIG